MVSAHLIREDELLPDPLGDRQITEVQRPPNKQLELERLYELADDGSLIPNNELIKAF